MKGLLIKDFRLMKSQINFFIIPYHYRENGTD